MAAETLRRVLPAWALQRGPWRALLLVLLAVVSWFAFARVQFNDGGLPLDKGRHLAAFATLAFVELSAGPFGNTTPGLVVGVYGASRADGGGGFTGLRVLQPGCAPSARLTLFRYSSGWDVRALTNTAGMAPAAAGARDGRCAPRPPAAGPSRRAVVSRGSRSRRCL